MSDPAPPSAARAHHPDDPPPPPKVPWWILAAIGVLALGASLTVHSGVGLVLLALAVGMWVQLPDPETDERQAQRRALAAEAAARREGRTVTPLRPTGTIEVDGAPVPARSIDGWLAAGIRVEVVNQLGDERIVRRIEPSMVR